MKLSSLSVLTIAALALAGCTSAPAPTLDQPAKVAAPEGAAPEPAPEIDLVGNACALLDDEYLDTVLDDIESTFGGALDFQPYFQEAPSNFCTWVDVTGAMSITVTLEDAATTETDDHRGRTYNIDSEPQVEPQDGPGEKAVILVDNTFADVRGEGFAYAYFFVDGDVAVYLTTVGLEIGRDMLRVLADEASTRLAAQ